MLTPEEKDIRDLQWAYEFQIRIASDRHNGEEIASKALSRASGLITSIHTLNVKRATARFRDEH